MSDAPLHRDADGTIRPYTDAEVAVRPATPPAPTLTIDGRLLIKALTDDQAAKLKARDQLRLSGNANIPVGNSLITRTAGVNGLDPGAWVAAARAQA